MPTLIQRRVSLGPRYLDSDIMSHLLREASSKSTSECTKEHGYIINVSRILRIISCEDTLFTVELEAETFKPCGGMSVNGSVCMVYKDGIFIDILKRQKMLIPTSTLKGYEFDEETQSFSDGKQVLAVGDTVSAVVTAAKYNGGKFSCFGSLA